MQSSLKVFAELKDSDVDKILAIGVEHRVAEGGAITQEGQLNESLFILLDGLLAVTKSSYPGSKVAVLGPGELIGEIAFLERGVPTATVTAMEASLLLEIRWGVLENELKDTEFAARFYRTLAKLNAQRLKDHVASVGRLLHAQSEVAKAEGDTWNELSAALEEFKHAMARADSEAIKLGGKVPEATAAALQEGFGHFFQLMQDKIGDASGELVSTREELGAKLQREMLPYLLLTKTAERFYSKPRGYAGDYLTIEMVYRNEPGGQGRLGPLLDQLFLNTDSSMAVRNRRGLLRDEIAKTVQERNGEVTNITTLACGPASELFDVYGTLEDKSRIRATLIDIDPQALEFVTVHRDSLGLQDQITLVNGNLVYLALGRQELPLENQDLMYSIGLIDYLNDKFVIKLLDWMHARLRVGGRTILGNFHPKNTTKAGMDYILNWKLIHRNEDDMHRLFSASAFKRSCTKIQFEGRGVNLFAECVKE